MTARSAAIAELRAVLEERAYGELYTLVAGGQLFVGDRPAARRAVERFDAADRALLHLLALDDPVEQADLPPRLGGLASLLLAGGLARREGTALRADDLVVVPVLRGSLLTATPPGWRPARPGGARAYLGEDSLRLARALPDARGKQVLDVGTGCGVQGLLAVTGAAAAVLTDVEPRSLELAACNRLLNDVPHGVEIRAGDGYEPVAGSRFDLVVALPPYLPDLPGAGEAAIAAGPDGLGLLRRLVAGAPDHLAPGGELVALAQLLCDDEGPLFARELALLVPGCEARLRCADWHPLQPYALELAGRLAASRRTDAGELLGQVLASLRALGATGVCSAIVGVRAAGGSLVSTPGAASLSPPARRRADDVLAPAPGLRFGEDRSLRSVSRPGAPPIVLPAHVAALLAAFDGTRDLGQAVEAAWGRPAGADPCDLLDQGIERADELERAGLLELPPPG